MVVGAGVVHPGEDEGDAAGGAVADPFLGAAQDPAVLVAAGAGFQRDRVGSVVGFGEGEGAEHLGAGQRPQPPFLLFGAAEQPEGAQGQPGLHGDHRAEGAVTAGDLHVDQAGGERGDGGQQRVRDAVGEQVQLTQAVDQVQGVFARCPTRPPSAAPPGR